jgi:hypothetical protein
MSATKPRICPERAKRVEGPFCLPANSSAVLLRKVISTIAGGLAYERPTHSTPQYTKVWPCWQQGMPPHNSELGEEQREWTHYNVRCRYIVPPTRESEDPIDARRYRTIPLSGLIGLGAARKVKSAEGRSEHSRLRHTQLQNSEDPDPN